MEVDLREMDAFKPILFVRKEDLPTTITKWSISQALKQTCLQNEVCNQEFVVLQFNNAFSISFPSVKIAKMIYEKGIPFSSTVSGNLDSYATALTILEYNQWEETQPQRQTS